MSIPPTSSVSQTRLPPGRMGLPIVGESINFILDPRFVEKRMKRYGPIFKTHIFGAPTVVVVGAEANRKVLATEMSRFSWREGWPSTLRELLGDSLFVQDGPEHDTFRRLLMPAFHGRALQQYFTTMQEITTRYVERWGRIGTFVWLPEFKQLSFEIASTLLLGGEPGRTTQRLHELFLTLTGGMFHIPLRWPWMPYGRARKARDQLLAHIEDAARHRQQHPAEDALGMLVQSRDEDGKGLEMSEIKVQALLLLFAGYETTSSMLTSLCLELARHPDVMVRARAEQHSLAAEGRLSIEQLERMPYLDQVLREVERVHPPAAGGFRGVLEPWEINGFVVPRGWKLMYRPPETHQDSRVYTRPADFDPDRFSPKRAEHKQRPFSLVGFGGGPRICLGMAFAQMEMKIIAAHVLRSYDWSLVPHQDLRIVHLPSRHPRSGLRVQLRPLHMETLDIHC